MINANLKLLYDKQQLEKSEREERRRRRQKKKAKEIPIFQIDMSAPNYWDQEEEESVTTTSVEESTSKVTGKLTNEKKEVYKIDKPFISKKGRDDP